MPNSLDGPARLQDQLSTPKRAKSNRIDWLVVACALALGCLLLFIGNELPRLWARQPGLLADDAVMFFGAGWIVVAIVFLPLWAVRWARVIPLLLAGAVLALLAGQIEGASPTRVWTAAAVLSALIGGFSTIWAIAPKSRFWTRLLWLSLVLVTFGWPSWRFLSLN